MAGALGYQPEDTMVPHSPSPSHKDDLSKESHGSMFRKFSKVPGKGQA